MAGTTRILVTHALHFLPRVDHILVIDNGVISESGSYTELMVNKGLFSAFITEFGAQEKDKVDKSEESIIVAKNDAAQTRSESIAKRQGEGAVPGKATVMQAEERNKGSVSAQGKAMQ